MAMLLLVPLRGGGFATLRVSDSVIKPPPQRAPAMRRWLQDILSRSFCLKPTARRPPPAHNYVSSPADSSGCRFKWIVAATSPPHTSTMATSIRSEEHTSELQSRFDL